MPISTYGLLLPSSNPSPNIHRVHLVFPLVLLSQRPSASYADWLDRAFQAWQTIPQASARPNHTYPWMQSTILKKLKWVACRVRIPRVERMPSPLLAVEARSIDMTYISFLCTPTSQDGDPPGNSRGLDVGTPVAHHV